MPQDFKASKAFHVPSTAFLGILYVLLLPLGDPSMMSQPMSWALWQNRLVQFSGNPGVGFTECYLAVSVPFSLALIMMWSFIGWKQRIFWSSLEGSDQPQLPSGGSSLCGFTLTWWGGLYSMVWWKTKNPLTYYTFSQCHSRASCTLEKMESCHFDERTSVGK